MKSSELYKQVFAHANVPSESFSLFDETVSRSANADRKIHINQETLNRLNSLKPRVIQIPLKLGENNLVAKLVKNELFTSNFRVENSKGEEINVASPLHYSGILLGKDKSMVSLNVYNDTVSGFASDGEDNYEIYSGDDEYFIESQIKNRVRQSDRKRQCRTERLYKINVNNNETQASRNVETRKMVRSQDKLVKVFIDVGVTIYNRFGGNMTNTSRYVTDLMAVCIEIFRIENITLRVSGLRIWDTQEPFTNLTTYINYREANRYDGNIAKYILSSDPADVYGEATLNSICTQPYALSVLDNTEIMNPAQPFPNYTWNSTTITHEIGHVLGSEHTFWCGWANGRIQSPGAIDGSGLPNPVDGGCNNPGQPTTQQSTIMSYANNYPLTNAFGTPLGGIYVQPGNKIRIEVRNAQCLETINQPPPVTPPPVNPPAPNPPDNPPPGEGDGGDSGFDIFYFDEYE